MTNTTDVDPLACNRLLGLLPWLQEMSHDGEFEGDQYSFNWTLEYDEAVAPHLRPNETISLFVKGSDVLGWRAELAYLCDGNGHDQAFVPLNVVIKSCDQVMRLLDVLGFC